MRPPVSGAGCYTEGINNLPRITFRTEKRAQSHIVPCTDPKKVMSAALREPYLLFFLEVMPPLIGGLKFVEINQCKSMDQAANNLALAISGGSFTGKYGRETSFVLIGWTA